MKHSLSEIDLDKTYTYADYLTWQFDEWVELIKGKVVPMAAPLRLHQRASKRIQYQFEHFFSINHCGCEIYNAPFDVRFPTKPEAKKEKEIYTVVQPDLCIFCDKEKLDDKGGIGAPDLIIEIISQGTQKRDKILKKELYQEFGVKEFWIVYPKDKLVEVFLLNESGKYAEAQVYDQEDNLPTSIIPQFSVNLKKVFED
ncbi:MAG: Uma2 family endonuclease [Thermoflexibacter sp.]|uniref:Endonuclease, Uma2 family (Restriction endonuclease fold) n=1 Tax=Thermoflexibacter ruber TaxID=1003 RepID=A0A1I2FYS5_9BACT|nr:Uma2 family endonuclease [Thermoflexibacter ruber]SFF10565.1 Endonuclease, Uma2 family (restriction endonuclease fold) [Thermoflexibacter ruber]